MWTAKEYCQYLQEFVDHHGISHLLRFRKKVVQVSREPDSVRGLARAFPLRAVTPWWPQLRPHPTRECRTHQSPLSCVCCIHNTTSGLPWGRTHTHGETLRPSSSPLPPSQACVECRRAHGGSAACVLSCLFPCLLLLTGGARSVACGGAGRDAASGARRGAAARVAHPRIRAPGLRLGDGVL